MRSSLETLLATGRVLLADGATGTNYFRVGLDAGEPQGPGRQREECRHDANRGNRDQVGKGSSDHALTTIRNRRPITNEGMMSD